MAKFTSPVASGISGKVGGLVFTRTAGNTSVVRRRPARSVTQSLGISYANQALSHANSMWKNMPRTEQMEWQDYNSVVYRRVSGYHLFIATETFVSTIRHYDPSSTPAPSPLVPIIPIIPKLIFAHDQLLAGGTQYRLFMYNPDPQALSVSSQIIGPFPPTRNSCPNLWSGYETIAYNHPSGNTPYYPFRFLKLNSVYFIRLVGVSRSNRQRLMTVFNRRILTP